MPKKRSVGDAFRTRVISYRLTEKEYRMIESIAKDLDITVASVVERGLLLLFRKRGMI